MTAAHERTILVVDDDEDLRSMVVLVLEDAGYRVRTAGDGIDALEHLARVRPDAILLDMRMPRMDGREFAKRLRTGAGSQIPLLVMTAAEQAEKWAREVGADDFVAKPFDIENLLRVVARHVRA
jgi:CheY-like chemotaxis protein